MNYPRFTKVIIDYFMTRKPSISRRNRIHWHYVRGDALFSTIKVVSRHQATQQYGAILPIELTTAEIRNSKAYQEYYACAMEEVAPKQKASARKKKGDSASSTTPPTLTPTTTAESALRLSTSAKGKQPLRAKTPVEPTDLQRTEAEQLKIEELSWKSSNDEEVGSHEEGKESDVDSDEGSDKDSDETVKSGAGKDGDKDDDEDDDDDDEEEETAKDDEEDKETGKDGDKVRKSGDSEKESDDEEEQESRLSEEARIQEEEDAEELYRDVNINQGRGLQVTQSVEDTHVILTLVNPDDSQESSSMSSFVSSMLNPLSNVWVKSIFTTTSSKIVSLEPPTPITTPSTIATITASGEAPIPPPTIPSIILENLPTFNSTFCFEERLRQETHISQQSGSDTGERTGSKPGVPDVPSDDSKEELSWKSSDDEDVGSHEERKKSDESDDDRDEGSDSDSDESVKSGAGKD
nr:hypothetical protein [Tanacetum cinerariifolium]